MKLSIYKATVFLFLLLLGACSSSKEILDKSIKQIQSNTLNSEHLKKLEVSDSSKDYLLFTQELSRIYFISNNPENTLKYSKFATDYYNQLDEKAIINVGGASRGTVASTIGNDNNLLYDGSDYERAFDYFYSALSYLRKNNLDSAMIDLRASSDIQKLSTSRREDRIMKAEKEINKKKNYSLGSDAKSILEENNKILSKSKNGFLNAYIYYISGNIRELSGDYNGALVDYKLALSINPNNYYIQQDAMRLGKSIDYSYYQDLTKSHKDNNDVDYKQQATVIVVYEQGFIPQKEDVKVRILGFDGLFYSMSLPVYSKSRVYPSLVSMDLYSNKGMQTKKFELLSDVYDLARNDLAEEYPMILARQTTRVLSKSVLQSGGRKIAEDNAGLGLLMYGIGAVSSLTESADVRSFRTLPHFVEVAKFSSKEGINRVKIAIDLKKSLEFTDINVNLGETVILYIIDTGNHIYKDMLYKSKKV